MTWGFNTVSLGYALYRLSITVPTVTNPSTKSASVKDLRSALEKKDRDLIGLL